MTTHRRARPRRWRKLLPALLLGGALLIAPGVAASAEPNDAPEPAARTTDEPTAPAASAAAGEKPADDAPPESADAETADETNDDDPARPPEALIDDAVKNAPGAQPMADGDPLPNMLVVALYTFDANGDYVEPPQEFDWTITATSANATYTSNEFSKSIGELDPEPGAYALDVDLNAAAASQLQFRELYCAYFEEEGQTIPTESNIQYQQNGAWHVDVRPQHVTICTYMYDVAGPLPDPHFGLESLVVLGSTDENGDRINPGEQSDWQVALNRPDGSVAETAPVGGDAQVPPGEYTPTLVASDAAQPGFDPSVWRHAKWYCRGLIAPLDYGDSVELEPGQDVKCQLMVTDADTDLDLDIGYEGDVQLTFDGLTGAIDTRFDIVVDVRNALGFDPGTDVPDLRVTVELPENVDFVDPQYAPDGWTLESVNGRTYVYAATGPLADGDDIRLRLPAKIVSAAPPAEHVRACASTELRELTYMNNCQGLFAVADGGDGGGGGNGDGDGDGDGGDEPADPGPEPEPDQPKGKGNPDQAPKPDSDPEKPESSKSADKAGALPATGSSVDGWQALGALALVGAGAGALTVRRLRRG